MTDKKTFIINRRQLFKSALGFLPFLAFPMVSEAADDVDSSMPLPSVQTVDPEMLDKIQELEAQLRNHNGFSAYLHNELRHYYGAVSEESSRRHADIILGHVVMDAYTMNTVSDWHLTHTPPDPQQAIDVMMGIVERYPYFIYLRAACLIKSGEAYEMLNMKAKSIDCYSAAQESNGAVDEVIQRYHQLADERLSRLKG